MSHTRRKRQETVTPTRHRILRPRTTSTHRILRPFPTILGDRLDDCLALQRDEVVPDAAVEVMGYFAAGADADEGYFYVTLRFGGGLVGGDSGNGVDEGRSPAGGLVFGEGDGEEGGGVGVGCVGGGGGWCVGVGLR
jgi:hypothetical protein